MANNLYLNVLKSIKGIILVPLCELINKSFTSGVFSSMYKIAKIVKTFKNKSRLYCHNYRPIFLLSNIRKNIEKVAYIQLLKFLEKNKFISEKQETICINWWFVSDTKLIFTGVTQGPNIENQGSIQYLSKSSLFSKKWAPKISQPPIDSILSSNYAFI